jgi:hypothetical protein
MIPYCAFNGGLDVWVDVGNKAEAIHVLQSYLRIPNYSCLHIGDQFSSTGNDAAARTIIPTLWIRHPSETRAALRSLLWQLGTHRGSNKVQRGFEEHNGQQEGTLSHFSTSLPLESEDSFGCATV